VTIKTATGSTTVNQSKVRKDHDEWHDVPLPRGLQGPLLVGPPELEDVGQPTDVAQLVFFMAPDQAFFMEVDGRAHAMTKYMSFAGYDVAHPMPWSDMDTKTKGPRSVVYHCDIPEQLRQAQFAIRAGWSQWSLCVVPAHMADDQKKGVALYDQHGICHTWLSTTQAPPMLAPLTSRKWV